MGKGTEFLSIPEIQAISGLSRGKVYGLLKEGLPHYRFGQSIRVRRDDFEKYLQEHKRNAK